MVSVDGEPTCLRGLVGGGSKLCWRDAFARLGRGRKDIPRIIAFCQVSRMIGDLMGACDRGNACSTVVFLCSGLKSALGDRRGAVSADERHQEKDTLLCVVPWAEYTPAIKSALGGQVPSYACPKSIHP